MLRCLLIVPFLPTLALAQAPLDTRNHQAASLVFLRFNPRGEANVNSTLPCTRIVEIGLQPTHGAAKNAAATDLVVVQQAGIGGGVNIYRP